MNNAPKIIIPKEVVFALMRSQGVTTKSLHYISLFARTTSKRKAKKYLKAYKRLLSYTHKEKLCKAMFNVYLFEKQQCKRGNICNYETE